MDRFLFEVRADVLAQRYFAPSGLVVLPHLDCETFVIRFLLSYIALQGDIGLERQTVGGEGAYKERAVNVIEKGGSHFH